MPIDLRPLFRPHVLHHRMSGFGVPDLAPGTRDRLRHWSDLLTTGRVEQYNETELLPDFLTDLFERVLGYAGPASGERYTLSREKHVEVDGKFADAVLGAFGPGGDRFAVAIEGKGPFDPLDRPYAGRRRSAVEQGYQYAINLPCDWIVVTNFREIRLFHKGHDQRTCERFAVARLASDDALLRRFVFVLGAERVVPPVGTGHLDSLLEDSVEAGESVTQDYYREYAAIRENVFDLLREANPAAAPDTVLGLTQKLLDRVLFVAFCEQRGLMPQNTLKSALEHVDPYYPKPPWDTFKALFAAIDRGSEPLRMPRYNGGLFAADPALDALAVPEAACRAFCRLAEFDYRAPDQVAPDEDAAGRQVDVEILGHIFEQSITDLERMQTGLLAAEPEPEPRRPSRRRREGAFYTPAFVTRTIVAQTLAPTLAERFEAVRRAQVDTLPNGRRNLRSALDDPRRYDLGALTAPQRSALVGFWEAWRAALQRIRLLDPACGSGAFLIEAFERFQDAYAEANQRLAELRGQPDLFDPDLTILAHNLYGVDLMPEAVEICRLSIWIKTAKRGRLLTDLDHNIRIGNSIVADPALDPQAFDWSTRFPEVFAAAEDGSGGGPSGGFDIVLGNPPYIRQERLGPIKPYLAQHYAAYDGMADLYVYFIERGLGLLRPGGRLSFILTNKWMKAGYGAPLRRFLAERAWLDQVVDFGHAKSFFVDADVFPSIFVARRPDGAPPPDTVQVCAIPRDVIETADLPNQIAARRVAVPRTSLGADVWSLEPPEIGRLLAKIRAAGVPLAEYVGAKPLYGIKTGFNRAFLIDTLIRERLVAADPKCAEIIKPCLRGQDIKRWAPDWAGLWIILLKSSTDHAWPWSGKSDEAEAEFCASFPSLHSHLKPFEGQLKTRLDRGIFWWELRSCAYYEDFSKKKIVYQEIQYHSACTLDTNGYLANNKAFFVANSAMFLLGVLNSPLIWWHNWRYLPHMKDEALTPVSFKMEALPIVNASEETKASVGGHVARLIEITKEIHQTQRMLADWLATQHGIAKLSRKLAEPFTLESDGFVEAVRRARAPRHGLTAAAVKDLRREYSATVAPVRALLAEAAAREQAVGDLVNAAYGLTPEDIDLMARTAPPRMPPFTGRIAPAAGGTADSA